MKFLVLGGTVFLGRHVVESALARGHSVTLFNRGRHNSNLFPKVEKLRGDRDGDLSALSGTRFDAVVDTTTYTPAQPRRIALGGEVLAPGRPERPIQFIDARDLADWCVRLSEAQRTGTFNAVGPRSLLTMQQFLETCRSVVGCNVRFNWISDDELIAA